MSIDIMFIDKLAILVGVSTPLGLTIAYSLNTADHRKPARTAAQEKIEIDHFIAVLAAQNFRTSVIMSDGEGAVKSLVDELRRFGVEVDVSGAGGHVARIERKIRISRVNRDQFRVLPMPESVIKRLNELAQADGRVKGKGDLYARPTSYEQYGDAAKGLPDAIKPIVNDGVDLSVGLIVGGDDRELISVDRYDGELHRDGGGEPEVQQYDSSGLLNEPDPNYDIEPYEEDIPDVQTDESDNDMDELVDNMNRMRAGPRDPIGDPEGGLDERGVPESYTSAGEIRDEYSDARDAVSRATELLTAPASRCCVSRHEVMDFFRNGSGTALLTRNYDGDGTDWGDYVPNISVNDALRTRGDAALSVIEKELKQMIDKKVWGPVDVNRLSWEEKPRIIRSSMLLKEKFLANGEFEKMKARLVAGGNQQDRDLYDDLSAPTVATSSVFTLLSIAVHENRTITMIVISGAFLNPDMDTGLAVHMRLDRNMSNIMIKLAPHYARYTVHKECIVVTRHCTGVWSQPHCGTRT